MAIEIVPQRKLKLSFWINTLLYICLFLILFFLISYFTLVVVEKKAKEKLAETTEALERTQLESLRKDLSVYQEKIDNFAILFQNHQTALRVFQFLEENCHPQVQFTAFDLNLAERRVKLSGLAENLEALQQQHFIFQNKEILEKADLSGVSLGKEGKVGFNFQLTFAPRIFALVQE